MCNKGIFFSISYLLMHDFFDYAQKKKKKKNQNAFTWLQVYFLGDVRVIWCNSLGETNVIDNVENLFNYYLHITFSALCTWTSCTHYTQINAKFCTYDCVLTNLAISLLIKWCLILFPWFELNLNKRVLKVFISIEFCLFCVKKLKIWEKNSLENFWKCSCALHIIKN